MTELSIYHIVPESVFHRGLSGDQYRPDRFLLDGFVYCADRPEVVLAVATDYFSDTAERLPFYASIHQFPHVCGPIDVAAITEIGCLKRDGKAFVWPEQFTRIVTFLDR